jgi:hypothetical protein
LRIGQCRAASDIKQPRITGQPEAATNCPKPAAVRRFGH